MSQPDPTAGQAVEGLDVRAYMRPIWRWKWVIAAVVVLATVGTYLITSREQKAYSATTNVYVENADPAASIDVTTPTAPTPPSQQQLQDIATLFTGQTITADVYSKLRMPVGAAGQISVTPASSSSFITVAASSHSPTLAAKLANTYVEVFVASQARAVAAAASGDAAAARAQLQIVDAGGGPTQQSQRAQLLAEIDEYETIARNPSPGVEQVDAAVVPTGPTSPDPKRDALFAAIIGLLLGVAIAFLLERIDRRLDRISTVQSLFGRPVIAVLPRITEKPSRLGATSRELLEPMRSLRVNLRLANGGRQPKSVLITSGLPGEGKSTVARNLAFACAEAGDRVLIVDCDMRRPSLARNFGLVSQPGLVQVLLHEATPRDAAVTVYRAGGASPRNGSNGSAISNGGSGDSARADPRAAGSISVMGHGDLVDSPASLLSATAMTQLLAAASTGYDTIILDTSPILTVSDAVPLLDQVAAVVFVARLGMTTRETAERLAELSDRVPHMNMVGVVVNDVRHRFLAEGHGYAGLDAYAYAGT